MGIAHREERSDFIDIQQKACGSVTFLVRGTLFSLPGWSTGRLYNIYFKGSRMERTYQAYGLTNYRNIRQITRLNKEELQAIEVVGRVLPFKTNNYVVEELIDWERIDTDPIFTLNFPRREMLSKKHFSVVSKLLAQEVGKEEFIAAVNAVRLELNPTPPARITTYLCWGISV